MLGVGKAAPAQFILRGKTNLRRISAAGQKAGFTAYPSHWASIWWDVIGGQCIFFVNTMQKAPYQKVRSFLHIHSPYRKPPPEIRRRREPYGFQHRMRGGSPKSFLDRDGLSMINSCQQERFI